ncbi:hemagglutinin repeat-containing protein [Herbaspirillum sp. C9C3]|uniref:hemagglutinin repeat-containing protein n=1 Tax=Herbaspirillum sp. C9C3 TaxID=2735271 RepID=UPI0032DE8E38
MTEDKFRQQGVTVAVTSPVLSAVQTVQQMAEAAGKTRNGRMQALAAANMGFAGKQAYDAISAGQGSTINDKPNQIATGPADAQGKVPSRDANAADKVGGINLAFSIGGSSSNSRSEQSSKTVRGSAVAAGGNVGIKAQGGGKDSSILIQGSDIKAGVNASLQAENEIRLLADQNTSAQNSSNQSKSGSVGFSIGTDGFMVNANASGSRGRGDGSDVEQVNTHVDAGNKVELRSGTDTTLRGAVVAGRRVEIDAGTSGHGNLNIESLQDSSNTKSKQQGFGASVSVGAGKMNGSVNLSHSRVEGEFASVNEQSGVRAGDEGFQVRVAGNTDLKGGKIASTDKAAIEGKNSLSTETLTQSDIRNRSSYKAESISVGAGLDGAKGSLAGTGIGIGSSSGNESSVTRSGISAADVRIKDDLAQQAKTGKTAAQTIAAINTEVSSERDTSGKLNKQWDAQALQEDVQAQAKIMETFGTNAAREIGNYATSKVDELDRRIGLASESEKVALIAERDKWNEGGFYRTVLHAAAGLLSGGIGGAAGAATSSMTMPQFVKLVNGSDLPVPVRQALAQAAAAALGGIAGGVPGMAAGLNVEANNRELHKTETEKLTGLKKGKSLEQQQRLDAAACALTRCAEGVPASDPYYGLLKGMQEKGATYKDEMTTLLNTGEFIYQPYLDAARDALTRYGETRQRTGGAADLLVGSVGMVGGGALTVAGAAACVPSAAASCALVPLGVYLAKVSNDQVQTGNEAVFGTYKSKEGKRVVDSFDIATYPGERDPLADIGIDAGKLGLTYLLGKYVPKGLAKAEEKLSDVPAKVSSKRTPERASPPGRGLDDKLLHEADFAGRIPVREDLIDHLRNGKIAGKEISGGHNEENFMQTLVSAKGTLVSRTEVAPGIYEIEYRLPKGSGKTPKTKTVYDPKVHDDISMGNSAQEAAAKGMIQYQSGEGYKHPNGSMVLDVQVNGINFKVPINNGRIPSVFPGRRN